MIQMLSLKVFDGMARKMLRFVDGGWNVSAWWGQYGVDTRRVWGRR
jgi:hypothetical protein